MDAVGLGRRRGKWETQRRVLERKKAREEEMVGETGRGSRGVKINLKRKEQKGCPGGGARGKKGRGQSERRSEAKGEGRTRLKRGWMAAVSDTMRVVLHKKKEE